VILLLFFLFRSFIFLSSETRRQNKKRSKRERERERERERDQIMGDLMFIIPTFSKENICVFFGLTYTKDTEREREREREKESPDHS